MLNLDVVWTAEFAANRWVAELPKDRFDLARLCPRRSTPRSTATSCTPCPCTSDGGLLYYRKDLLKQGRHPSPPKTWDEMETACQKVMALPEAKDMSCYAGQFDKYEGLTVNFSEAVDSAGGSIVDDDGKPNVDTPQAKQGLSFLVDGFKNGLDPEGGHHLQGGGGPPRRSRTASSSSTASGRTSTRWPSRPTARPRSRASSSVAPLPGLNGPGVVHPRRPQPAISAFAKNKATALDFIKFLTSEQSQQREPARQLAGADLASLYDDPALIEEVPVPAGAEGVDPAPSRARWPSGTAT